MDKRLFKHLYSTYRKAVRENNKQYTTTNCYYQLGNTPKAITKCIKVKKCYNERERYNDQEYYPKTKNYIFAKILLPSISIK